MRVFSDICAHLACRVNWHPDLQHYASPCHDGRHDILEKNISGPPPRPLDEFVTKIEDGNLYMSLLQKPFPTAKSAENAKEIQMRIKNVNLSCRLS